MSYIKYRNPGRFKYIGHIKKYQEKKINRFIRFLYKNSGFYNEVVEQYGQQFDQLPIMDKELMMRHFDDLVTVDITKEKAYEMAINSERTRDFAVKYNRITVGLSSGTSGHRGLFIASQEEADVWTGAILARMLPNVLKKHKIAFFLRANSNLYENVKSNRLTFRYFDIYEDMLIHINTLNEYQPDILVAPPSVLLLLAKAVEEKKLVINIKKVISVAEVLDPFDQRYFESVFNLNMIHQVYQCTEGFLGFTCKHGKLHLNEDIILVEKEYIDEKRFIPIITDFTRKSQPIVRYRLNDVLVEGKTACPCGCKFMTLDAIEGREDDIFIFHDKNGKEVYIFSDMIRRCMLYVDGINQYQVIQVNENVIQVLIDCRDIEIENNITKEFDEIFNGFSVQVPEIKFGLYTHTLHKKMKRIIRL